MARLPSGAHSRSTPARFRSGGAFDVPPIAVNGPPEKDLRATTKDSAHS